MHPSSGVRRALPFLLPILIGLTACRGEGARAPFTDSRTPPGLEHRFYPPQGWTWGLIQIGDRPAARYGVSAPAAVTRVQVLILTSYGDPAETWFETAVDLNARGYVVWVLEPIGQGGSGRYARRRDLGHAPSLDPDVATLLAFPDKVARGQPLFVLASGTAAPVAIRAAALGLKAKGLILSSPELDPGLAADVEKARRMRQFGLAELRATGAGGWRREGPAAQAARERVRQAWQIANPDLRMGGPSWGWRAAFADEVQAARRAQVMVRMPTLVIADPVGAAVRPCDKLPNCVAAKLIGPGRDPRLSDDKTRTIWLQSLAAFIEAGQATLAPSPPGATVEPAS